MRRAARPSPLGSPGGRPRGMRVVTAAIASRACALLLALACDFLLPNHEAEGVLLPEFGPDCDAVWLRTFTRWDSAHFLHVARRGWTMRVDSHAFFPLSPLLLRAGAWALGPLAGGALCAEERLLVAGLLLSNVAFVAAAWLLDALGCTLLRDRALARSAALLFCVSPASVFFSSVYTESLFAAASFSGGLLLARGRPNGGAAALCVASCLRSNGILGVLLILCDAARHTPGGRRRARRGGTSASLLLSAWDARTCARCAAVLAPYVLWQAAGYARFCTPTPDGHAPPLGEWCARRVPDLYARVQADHWGVGLFRSYRARQLPNFALAAPALALCACACAGALAVRADKRASRRIGVRARTALRVAAACAPHPRANAHLAHWAALSAVCALVANVGVTPRLVCGSCAAYYWCVASLLRPDSACPPRVRAALRAHVVGYAVVGTALHANWFPYV